jgi:hypothetical protein
VIDMVVNRVVGVLLAILAAVMLAHGVLEADPFMIMFAYLFFVGALILWWFGGRKRPFRP